MLDMLPSSVVTITGGTGSFGRTMARNLLNDGVSEVRIFSRDENKQDMMRNEFKDERLRFFIGDVRDPLSVENVIRGSDYVFHAAALKQVPSCEFFPMQAAATNVSGSSNVMEASFRTGVKTIVCLSTDKAVYPINAMGMTKALMEKVAQSYARSYTQSGTKIAITRYGNVMMSRGSVIPLFINQIRAGLTVTVTDPSMTRFLMSLQDSVDLVKYAFVNADSGDLFVKKAPGCSVETLIEAIAKIEGKKGKIDIRRIGVRHGEKHAEALLASEERSRSEDLGSYFKVPLDTRSLDYQIYFEKGQSVADYMGPYTSSNTSQLDVDQVAQLISDLPEYKSLDRAVKNEEN
jgi:UDP-N-acetylglucosamine 4,6-dehydratase/5-epimerase